jgi:hypothetical protein
LLARLTQGAHRRQARTYEIADRLMRLIRDPDRSQFTSPMQLGEINRIPPVGLDPVARLSRDQRRSHHNAFMHCSAQLPLDAVTARSGFIAESQFAITAGQFYRQRLQGSRCVCDLPVLAHLSPLARLGKRNRNGILVYVEADVGDRLLQDPSPMHEARTGHPAQPSITCIL